MSAVCGNGGEVYSWALLSVPYLLSDSPGCGQPLPPATVDCIRLNCGTKINISVLSLFKAGILLQQRTNK